MFKCSQPSCGIDWKVTNKLPHEAKGEELWSTHLADWSSTSKLKRICLFYTHKPFKIDPLFHDLVWPIV